MKDEHKARMIQAAGMAFLVELEKLDPIFIDAEVVFSVRTIHDEDSSIVTVVGNCDDRMVPLLVDALESCEGEPQELKNN